MVLEACEQGEMTWRSKAKGPQGEGEKKAFVVFLHISPLPPLNMASEMKRTIIRPEES